MTHPYDPTALELRVDPDSRPRRRSLLRRVIAAIAAYLGRNGA